MKPAAILARLTNYKFARHKLVKPAFPINLTFSVTHKCQSRCRTCNIGIQSQAKEKKDQECSISEIEKIFSTMGIVHFFNISGGCPFLREDLPEIIRLACIYLKPRVIHIPTNGLIPEQTVRLTETILNIISNRYSDVSLQLKPSIDGIGDSHDSIRGIKGNFIKVELLIRELKALQEIYPQLHVGIGTVISKLNIGCLSDIILYVEKMCVDSYIAEIAEIRAEMFNEEMALTPSADEYEKLLPLLINIARRDRIGKRRLVQITQSFREVYYKIVLDILRNKKQVIPCYGGISNVHINAYGDIWPCCVLGNNMLMGNLRDTGYDFNKIWLSPRAFQVREYIRNRHCYCPMANQAYANILCDWKKLIRVLFRFVKPRWDGRD